MSSTPTSVQPTGQSGESKKEGTSTEHINLKVVGSDHNEMFFKIKRTTQLKKLMDAFCERQGKAFNSLRFLYDGERVQPHNTPLELEMEDGDAIDVMVEQTEINFDRYINNSRERHRNWIWNHPALSAEYVVVTKLRQHIDSCIAVIEPSLWFETVNSQSWKLRMGTRKTWRSV
ncbi:ubiquitin-like protein [Gigaspora margarita]|uniref:Ubiquitin-like protein n=1 Tax=Gigaspora margarita TaxID=4874 RepID=A0A8H3X427_GIGMA|nr:ubiquitin-like protein [Gigaspora margarita]